ncbi:MAG TPA: diaminopimelate epimerase [Leptospiraceae bacterium]|nr:diaminopimelate epimerase [Spirochaetaceae bacterium]HBS07097.1 diaminopimelate epimerase [Leptospiraceae bacterium]|tara:strand:+ start:53537 stop:54481 length:945 start_codon:yes stop_codon:yes gene_type:complete
MRIQQEPTRFRKMEATGNDYVYFGPYLGSTGNFDIARTDAILQWLTESTIRRISDRHFGVGGDGVVLVAPPRDPDAAAARMYMWNADGSPSAMCGNALRSVALLIHLETRRFHFSVEMGESIYDCKLEESGEGAFKISVDMGPPILPLDLVPFAEVQGRVIEKPDQARILPARVELDAGGISWSGYTLSMGNPHFVVDLGEHTAGGLDGLDLRTMGPVLEHHSAFPERVNTEFIEWKDSGRIRQRTFERGSGETLSCGSGACAAFIAARASVEKQGRTLNELEVELRGGVLELSLHEDRIQMTGPAHIVFEGWI